MGKIEQVEKMTDNPFVNLYYVRARSVHDTPVNYYVASRAKSEETLKLNTKQNHPDGVIIYSLYGPERDRVVLIRQYRYAIGGYIYEFPAGLVEKGENFHQAAARELKEETGLTLTPIPVKEMYEKPYFTTVGLTDESCASVYGYASGTVSSRGEEDSEEIEVVLADRAEARRILEKENVAIMCAYMLMHFIEDEDAFAFLRTEEAKENRR